jgi:hypothetical protein
MVGNLSEQNSAFHDKSVKPDQGAKLEPIPESFEEFDIRHKKLDYQRKEVFEKNHYFDNETVERLMHRYLRTACTEPLLRDEIMQHASELIRQIIKAHNLGHIYPGKEESSIMDLFQTAWIQIESALYKYQARPHCSRCYNNLRPNDSLLVPDEQEYIFEDELFKKTKECPNCNVKISLEHIYYKGRSRVFNLWSQVSRTVILAYIKKENRDRKNSGVFRTHLENRSIGQSSVLQRFITEAREISKHNDDHMAILATLEQLYEQDDRAHEGLVAKIVERTKLSRGIITSFFKLIRLRGHEFTDSPINEQVETMKTMMEDPDEDGTF